MLAGITDLKCNTVAENQHRFQYAADQQVWVFGYGSLIYKVDFPFIESRPASIDGWMRRFWQGSHDHRGNLQNPGRVVTLIEESNAICTGIAYLVEASVFEQLDVREKNGYLRLLTEITFADGAKSECLVYIATPDNEAFLGDADDEMIAEQILTACGESGENREYLLKLANALRSLKVEDPHVFNLETHLKRLIEIEWEQTQ
ncbi:MAG: cation transport protein ChaC [Gammaproteobacteria bacterium]|jgi:cation transport protein ChaC